jgi:hypothetical protein
MHAFISDQLQYNSLINEEEQFIQFQKNKKYETGVPVGRTGGGPGAIPAT